MKERSIILSGPMVLAAMDGRKTMFRVEVNPQPFKRESDGMWLRSCGRNKWDCNERLERRYQGKKILGEKTYRVPFNEWILGYSPYKVGDRIWVRETWGSFRTDPTKIVYKADTPDFHPLGASNPMKSPAIMPRSASRLTLEITGVKVEKLNDIGRKDAVSEGVPDRGREDGEIFFDFIANWESTHGPGSWAKNPWVFARTFKAVKT